MMVMHFNAGLTVRAMKRSRRPEDIASSAFHTNDFLPLDNCNVIDFDVVIDC
jgi:hypothetical protein